MVAQPVVFTRRQPIERELPGMIRPGDPPERQQLDARAGQRGAGRRIDDAPASVRRRRLAPATTM